MDRITFKQFLSEKFYNAFSTEEKKKYADQVWEVLSRTYKSVGGLAGIKSKDEMIAKTKMWKVGVKDDKVLTVILYKDHGKGRKIIGVGTDGTSEGKDMLRGMLQQEFTRSYVEMRDPLYSFMKKHFPDLIKKYTIPPEQAAEILDSKTTSTKDGFYKRTLGDSGKTIENILIGTPGKEITR